MKQIDFFQTEETTMRKKKRKTAKKKRHPFRFRVLTPYGTTRTLTTWAKTKTPTRKVEIELRAEDIRKAIEMEGFGNTQTCMMAVCVNRHAKAFSHPIKEFIDWQYRSAFVCSKLDKNGMPSECYPYQHQNKYAQHFDKFRDNPESRKKIKQLIAELEKSGPMVITLHPPRPVKPHTKKGKPEGKKTGERSKVLSKGAHQRFGVANSGLTQVKLPA